MTRNENKDPVPRRFSMMGHGSDLIFCDDGTVWRLQEIGSFHYKWIHVTTLPGSPADLNPTAFGFEDKT